MRSYIRGIREQLNAIGTIQVLQGKFDETTDTEVFVKLGYKKSVFTWAITLTNMNATIIKPQLFYYNSATKQRKTSGAIPE